MALPKASFKDELAPGVGPLVWGMRLLCGAALLVTGYLAVTALRSEQVAGCGGGAVFDCGHVLTSRWSKLFGLPVSVPAVALYGGMLGALWFCQSSSSASIRRRAWDAIVTGAIAAGLAAVWFLSLQILAIGHLCFYCMIAHTCGLAMCGAVLWWRPVGLRRTAVLAAVSAAGVGLMISAQLLAAPPETFIIEHHAAHDVPSEATGVAGAPAADAFDSEFAPPTDDSEFAPPADDSEFQPPTDDGEDFELFEPFGATHTAPMPQWERRESGTRRHARYQHASLLPTGVITALTAFLTGSENAEAEQIDKPGKADAEKASNVASADPKATKPAKRPERRLVSISGGKVRLDVRQWPLLGRPDAKYVFVEMFDYTCPHCRTTHRSITGAKQKYGDDLAIVALAVPLSRDCNPTVKNNNPNHAEACELARIAVAVWRVDPPSFSRFHDWVFEPSRGRTAAQARRYAAQLVGEEAINKELARPVAGKYIAKHVELYQRVGAGSVPKLLFRDSTVVGEVRTTERLCGLIEREHRP